MSQESIDALINDADSTGYLVSAVRRTVSAVRRLLVQGEEMRRRFGPLPDLDALVGWPEAVEAELLRMENGQADPDHEALHSLSEVGFAHVDVLVARLSAAMNERAANKREETP